jgi:protoporphyrinogen oxidase
MAERTDILIIGGGPTGLGAAWRLDALRHGDWRLYEAEAVPGGLAGSVTDAHGFTWDLGGHVQFSHYAYFDRLMDELLGPDGWLHHERAAAIWTGGIVVPYPFQLNLHRLPRAERDACMAGLLARRPPDGAPRHLGEWIDQRFGAGIASLFLRPYNRKVWAHPLEELSCGWVGERVALVDVDRVRGNVERGRDDVGWGPNHRFRFPRRGGTGAVWRELARRLADRHPEKIRMSRAVGRLDTARRVAYLADGEPVRYERLLSTAPLDLLVAGSDLAGELRPAADRLRYSSTHVIGVGLRGRPDARVADTCWMYFPDAGCPFHRVTVFSRYSPDNVPDPERYWSLLVEVSESPARPAGEAAVTEGSLAALVDLGIVPDRRAVHSVWRRRLERGYPTPTLGRDDALARILPALEKRDVYSRGRFGAWRYEVSNQDHSFAQGVEAIDRWLTGAPEITVNDPESVNRRTG